MATLYKLTNEKKQTKNNTTWGEGIAHSGTGEGLLCSEGWIHAYRHPLLATFFNPIHGNFDNPLLWEAEGEVALDDGMKVGCQTLTTVKQIELPEMSVVQRVACGILAVKEVYKEEKWNEWAEKWLSGEDRSRKSIEQIREEAYIAAAFDDAYAAYAAYAAEAADAVIAAYYAATAASAASYAIRRGDINVIFLLRKAMKYK